MYDAASQSDAATLQRAVGELRVGLRVRDGQTVLEDLYQSGNLKARFPQPQTLSWSDVVTLNTSGGIAGGDILVSQFHLRPGTQATIASQAAERFYRALPGSMPSSVTTTIVVDRGAVAEWLPQETILFDRCLVRRHLRVELEEGARFLGVESLIFGRTAMGESVHHATIQDAVQVRRSGTMILYDAVRLAGEVDARLQRAAIAGGARSLATVWYVAPDADEQLSLVRELLPQTAGASAWNGMLVTRLLASDSAELRRAMIAVLHTLRSGRPLPRVWLC